MHGRQQVLLRLDTELLVQDTQCLGGPVIKRGTSHQPLVSKGITNILANSGWIEERVQRCGVPDRRRLVGTTLIDREGGGVVQQTAAVLGDHRALTLTNGEASIHLGVYVGLGHRHAINQATSVLLGCTH